MRRYKVTLAREEREELEAIVQRGNHRAQKVINALVLLNCDQGQFQVIPVKNEDVAAVLRISMRKIDRVKKRFVEEGFETALTGRKGNRVYEKKADGGFEAHLVALSCGEPPEVSHDGLYACWQIRLWSSRTLTAFLMKRFAGF